MGTEAEGVARGCGAAGTARELGWWVVTGPLVRPGSGSSSGADGARCMCELRTMQWCNSQLPGRAVQVTHRVG